MFAEELAIHCVPGVLSRGSTWVFQTSSEVCNRKETLEIIPDLRVGLGMRGYEIVQINGTLIEFRHREAVLNTVQRGDWSERFS